MYNKFLFLILIVIVFIIIITFIYYNKNDLKEKFTEPEPLMLNFPALSNTAEITIIYPKVNVPNPPVSIREKYDVTARSATSNISTDGYGVTYVNSSFIYVQPNNLNQPILGNIYIPSPNNTISSLFNNETSVTLRSPNNANNNYISIILPDKFQFLKTVIKLSGSASGYDSKIFVYAFQLSNRSMYKINSIPSIADNTITLSVGNTNGIYDIITFDNLIIYFDKSISLITLRNIKIYGFAINSITESNQNAITSVELDTVGVFTDNINSQFTEIDVGTMGDYSLSIESGRDTNTNFNLILKNNNPPWAIYSADKANFDILPELFNRTCKNARIIGSYSTKNEPPTKLSNEVMINNNSSSAGMPYIEGNRQTKILFPPGSLPPVYTICAITKYTDPLVGRNRILTGSYPRNWLLGHWADQDGGVTYNDGWVYYSYKGANKKMDWRVSCVKSRSNNPSYSLIINGQNIAWGHGGGNYDPNAILTINGWPGEESNFGFAYLIIWDYVLSDSELLVVSNTLTTYIETGIPPDTSNTLITISDGSTSQTAGRSAYDIKLATCTNTNGIYWIKKISDDGRTISTSRVYCIMDTNFQGGGWMLVMKGTNSTGTFTYNSGHWTTETRLNENDFPSDISSHVSVDSKYDIFNYYKVTSCIAVFDERDTNISNQPNLCRGWVWIHMNFYNNSLSLKDFYAQGKEQFAYYSSGNHNFTNGKDARYVLSLSKNEFKQKILNGVYNEKVWARQEEFMAYGFNIRPYGWSHAVRWGGTFNENWGGVPNTNDVSGGIGVQAAGWNAGNVPICCEFNTGVRNVGYKQMGFKWYIK